MSGPAPRDLPGGNRVEVVGESFHAAALRGLVDDGLRTRWASLIPEPHNPYDANAVAVFIEGVQVGYLGREVAIVFSPVAARIRELGFEVRCAATIGGGRGAFGVELDLGTPDECLGCLNGA